MVSVSPVNNSLTVQNDTEIPIHFSQSVAHASLKEKKFIVFGRWSGIVKGEFSFNLDTTEIIFTAERFLFKGEMVKVFISHNNISESSE
ncbi:MAG: hypothetical protein Kow0098_00470 [Ignavibacteriaceae bacterium]